MLHNSLLAVPPFLIAALMYLAHFYQHERAGSATSPTFLMGLGSVGMAVLYLGTLILHLGIPYGAVIFGVGGILAVIHAIRRYRGG